MANAQQLTELKAQLDRVLAFKKDALISRPAWGEINFEGARHDFDRIFDVVNHLSVLPIELLPDSATAQTRDQLRPTADTLKRINDFRVSDGNPAGTRDSLVNEVHARADQLFEATARWIPFLAYQKGDVARNIQSLTDAVASAEKMASEAKEKIQQRATEIENIITKAREASAAAGAAVFTRDFQNIADALDRQAGTWLKITLGAALVTLGIAAGMWFWTEAGLDQGQVFQKLSTKLVILGVLLTATVWCGRNYKALKHLATVNRHRAMSIQTLQAFSAAAADVHAKDAVLLEATRAVFGNVPTGYVGDGASDGDLKIVEIARSVLPKGDKA